MTPAAVAPVPAALDSGNRLPFVANSRLTKLVDGTTATLANQGEAQTLKGILKGSKAFVIAYAAANL